MNASNENRINPKIRIGESPIHGRGMFAEGDIGRGEILIIWKECYTDKIGAEEAVRQGKGIMQWDDDVFSYETDRNPEHYLINHSCDPNGWMADAYTLEARRDIPRGEEITVDIAMFEHDEDAVTDWSCNCGSPMCRGRIKGMDWRREDLQKRYEGHFSPLINKRIEKLNP
jgi:hypothetical protein